MHRFFLSIYYYVRKNRLIAAVAAVLFLAVSLFFASKIKFDEDISQIIPKGEKSDLTAKVLSQLNFSDRIIVIIESKDNGDGFSLSETADSFTEKIQPLKPYIKSVQGKVEDNQISETFDFVSANLPLLLNENDYKIIEQRIRKDSIAAKTEANYKALVSPTSLVTKDFIKKDPLGISFLGLEKLNSLNLSKDFKLEDNYVVTNDGKNLLLFIEPVFGGGETKNSEVFVEKLNRIKDQLNSEFKGKTEISYFGSPIIAVANAKQIKKDIQSTVLISSGILLLLLIFYFRNFFAPVIIFIPTIFGAAGGLFFMYLIKDRISAISLSVSAILIGITIDYAIHVLTHYKHKQNIEEVFREIVHPVMMSASTTAVSFLCLVFVRSEALKDLGIFASVTVLLSAVFTLIIIPHIYQPSKKEKNAKPTVIDKIGAYPYEKNKWLIIFCTILIVASFFGFTKIKFNQNINDLNYIPADQQANEKKLQEMSDLTDKSVYVVSYGNSEAEALEKNSKLVNFLQQEQKKGEILSFNSIGEIMLSEKEQHEKIRKWNEFWTPEKKQQTLSAFRTEGHKFGFNSNAFDGLENLLKKADEPISNADYKNLKALQLSEFLSSGQGIHTVSTVVKLNEKNRDRFIKSVEQNHDVLAIDRQQINENFLGLLKDDFNTLVNYSLIAVIVIFFLFFRNVDLTVMAVIPIVLSGVVTAGILYFLGLELNIFSTIVCTLIFGAGVDFNIFLTQALQKEITTGKEQLPLYRVSIILALLTTVLAVGALVFAKHPALFSVSSVALVGLLAVTVISFAMYPLTFRFMKNRAEKGLSPVSFRTVANSFISLIYYGLGGLFFSFIGHFFIRNSKGKMLENTKKFVAFYVKSVLYSNPFVKKKVINAVGEDFSKPSVIIANHNSSLDTLSLGMVTHKIVYLVNDWVYKSPFFGRLVRDLGFFPVSQGIENGIDKLQEKIDQGYSLMIFPEAERSLDNDVKRFHKGAFYLAEKYGLDILPVYIHGNSEVMPKGDLFIHDGAITVKVGERISHNDENFGKTYSERTKKINAEFRQNFAAFRKEREDENYFRKVLFRSFMFKENDVVESVKKVFEHNKSVYHRLNPHLGKNNTILHIADDFGQKDALFVLQEASRKIFSYIENEERRDVAKQNYLVKRRKLIYVEELTVISKNPDILLISTEDFDFSGLKSVPKTIIFLTVKPSLPEDYHHQILHEEAGFIIYGIKE